MNKNSLLFSLTAIALFSLSSVQAQNNQYHIKLSGTSTTTDASGHIVHLPINNRTLLRDVAKLSNLTDTSWLGLAYHVGGNDLGDTIDVINRTNGATLRTLYGLYFGEAFGRQELTTSDNHTKRIEYIYTDQNSHSLGSVVLNDFYNVNNGQTNHTMILGTGMEWLVTTDSTHTAPAVCTGSFVVQGHWTFGGQ
jgi:hypothetical protein